MNVNSPKVSQKVEQPKQDISEFKNKNAVKDMISRLTVFSAQGKKKAVLLSIAVTQKAQGNNKGRGG
jgi:hypothetical protein